jgi:hypothetical protein
MINPPIQECMDWLREWLPGEVRTLGEAYEAAEIMGFSRNNVYLAAKALKVGQSRYMGQATRLWATWGATPISLDDNDWRPAWWNR